MYSWDEVKDFWNYLEYYPYKDEPDYDGIHSGGIKGLVEDAPETAKEAFKKFQKMEAEAKKNLEKY